MVCKDKPTVAVMTAGINLWYNNEIIKGIRSAADEKGVNLRFFIGGSINAPWVVERERNVVYNLINEHNADGILVISASLCEFLSPEEVSAYCAGFAPLPLVGIGDFPGHIPHILSDNKKGMYAILCHLIKDHGFRKIAFISGPASNAEAAVRLETYKQALRDNHITVDPDYIVYGTFTWDSSKEQITELLDRRKLDIEAIACANDEMAFGAYYELKERKIDIPGQIAITGFDDIREARFVFPPLTTVNQSLFAQGAAALNMVLEKITSSLNPAAGPVQQKTSPRLLQPTDPVIRQSCGCGNLEAPPVRKEERGTPVIIEELPREVKCFGTKLIERLGAHYVLSNDTKKEDIRTLYGHLIHNLKDGNSRIFSKTLKKIIYHEQVTEEEINHWRRIIKVFNTHIKETIGDSPLTVRLRNLTGGAKNLMDDVRNLIVGMNQVQSEMKMATYQYALDRIGFCRTIDDLLISVQENVVLTGLECFYLTLYPWTSDGAAGSCEKNREQTPAGEESETIRCRRRNRSKERNEMSWPWRQDRAKRRKPMVRPETNKKDAAWSGQDEKLFGYPGEFLPIYEGRMLLGFDGEKLTHYPDADCFSLDTLVPGGDFKYKNNNHFIIYPLCINGHYFGIIVMEYYESKERIYDPLLDRLCTTLWTIKQFKEIEGIVSTRTKELEEANEKLKELDKAKTNFFANISHELRTPLTLILSPLESLLAGDYGDPHLSDESVNTVFTAMQTNSVRLLKLINNLLDFSKIEAGKMKLNRQPTDINKLLHFYKDSIHSGVESKGLTFEFIDRTEKTILSLDRDLFEKAFFNLLSNAMKFSPEGGTITIELMDSEKDILIKVKDNGIGIPSDKLDSIFERFSQVEQSASRKYEGTGIGLAFSREIIELHHGTLSVQSEQGKGSTFTIHLPRENDSPGAPGKNETAGQIADFHEINIGLELKTASEHLKKNAPNGQDNREKMSPKNSASILIVEDNSSMRDFISGLLTKKYTVITAVHGKDALERMEMVRPDLIISDVMMPEMDGMELCRILKEDKKTANIPLILLTARMDMGTRIKGLKQKADDYLLKPFNTRELFARIENLLEKRRLELELQKTTAALWSELETARQIQNSLLPENPVIPGFEIACYIKSASEVSGDYYDVITVKNRSWLVIGDVSGHGITAGLIMMMVQTAINILLSKHPGIKPSELLSDINMTIKNNISKLGQEKYMTISVFALLENRRFMFSGLHQDIYIYRARTKTVEVVESRGMWIGFIDDISNLVTDDAFEMEQGDTLLLYTDGITEAVKKDPAREKKSKMRFGNEKLINLFRQHGQETPENIKKVLIKELDYYICDDDFTFLIIQRT